MGTRLLFLGHVPSYSAYRRRVSLPTRLGRPPHAFSSLAAPPALVPSAAPAPNEQPTAPDIAPQPDDDPLAAEHDDDDPREDDEENFDRLLEVANERRAHT